MKHSTKFNFLLALATGFGGLGLILGQILYALATDDRGLLVRHHPLAVLLWLLVPAALLLAVLGARSIPEAKGGSAQPRPSLCCALGHVLAAMGIALGVLTADATALGSAGTVWRILGLLACLGLLLAAWQRCNGKKISFLCYLALCLFLLAHLVSHYRQWCADPQILNYLFELLGIGMWMLFSYYCACTCVGMGSRRLWLATGLLTVTICLAALGTQGDVWLCLGGGIFAGTSLYRPADIGQEEAP